MILVAGDLVNAKLSGNDHIYHAAIEATNIDNIKLSVKNIDTKKAI